MQNVGFKLSTYAEPLEKQANRQGYTLGNDADRLQSALKAIAVCGLHVATQSQVDSMNKKLLEQIIKALKPIPEIVCLCGPLRFMEAFRQAEYDLEMQGKIVLAPSFLPGATEHDGTTGCTPEQKIMLDELHKRKIDMSDTIFVINVGGYIGESTKSEIAYAEKIGKGICYLEYPRIEEE